MSTPPSFTRCSLPSRAVIAIGGEERSAFLQGLLSNDVSKATHSQAIYTLLLTPQGKFLHDMFILSVDGRYLIDCDAARRDDLLQRLKRYRLRAKVTLEALEEWSVAASPTAEGMPDDALAYQDPRMAALGWRALCPTLSPAITAAEYEQHRMACAVPDGTHDMLPEQALPMDYGMDRLHAIDFNKGCFVGQEVTARTKHRATLRKAVFQVHSHAALPPHGSEVTAGDKRCGMLLSNAGQTGLALLRIAETQAALDAATPMQAADAVLTVTTPSWRV